MYSYMTVQSYKYVIINNKLLSYQLLDIVVYRDDPNTSKKML